MVDYSKWDKMQFDSDDEEQDATRMDQKMYQDFSGIGRTVTGKSGVKVTKLDSTSSVTFGGGNRGKVVADVDKLKSSATTATAQGCKTEKTVVFDSDFKTWTRNGALHGEQYAWSQTRNEVDVYIFVPSHIKGKDLDVQVLEKSLKITLKNDVAIDTPVVLTSPKDEERSNRSVVIDEEFAFLGPSGFDLGAFIANLVFALIRHHCLGNKEAKELLQQCIPAAIDCYSSQCGADMSNSAEFVGNACGFIGVELIRRFVVTGNFA